MAPTILQRVSRNGVLIAGVLLALVAAFHPGLQRVFGQLKDVEETYHVALLPALAVLFAGLMLHQMRRRQETAATAATNAADARAMRRRAEELERFAALERGVAESLDLLTLRQRLEEHLPGLVGLRDAWVLLLLKGRWEPVVHVRSAGQPAEPEQLEQVAGATLALAEGHGPAGAHAEIALDGHTCFPLRVGGSLAGVLGVVTRDLPITEAESRVLEATAGLLAIGAKNVELVAQIREHGMRDGLTGCFNRTHALETLRVELRRSQRSQSPLSVVMLDLDHFKDVNDAHGHLAGDAVLATAGRLLRDALRSSDLKCRYGGEEFLLLLPDTPPDAARVVAEMLRGLLARTPIAADHRSIPVTASFGVTTAAPGEQDAEQVIARADQALYAAKRAGRNCVRVAPVPAYDTDALAPVRSDYALRSVAVADQVH